MKKPYESAQRFEDGSSPPPIAPPALNRYSLMCAHIPDDQDIHYILSRVRCLKGTTLNKYETKEHRRNKRIVKLRHEVERVTGRRKMPLYHDHLTIDGIKSSWTDGKLISGHLDGAKKLSELTGYDFTEFLTTLEGEDDGDRPRSRRTPSPGAVTTLQADSNHHR
ncbi:hypothetical protein J6590_019250 [Homalodisca vitripennis]|nr:hypothetical protein J6590_019250 [Homalodisca vitripennis]